MPIIGMRHGEVHNPDWVIYAGLDGFGLSEVGVEQARAAAKDLVTNEFEAIYCSPLQRAVETATIVGGVCGVVPTPDERLTEWKFWGRWAGKSWSDVRDDDPKMLETYLADPGLLEGEESLDELTVRVNEFVSEKSAGHEGRVLVVSHLEPLRAYIRCRDNLPSSEMGSIIIEPGEWVNF